MKKSPKQQKAVLITRFPYESSWGGEESHTLDLARYLQRKGLKVIFMGSCPVLLKRFKEEGFVAKKAWGGRMIVTPVEALKSFFLAPIIFWSLKRAFQSILKKENIKHLYCLSLNEKLFLSGTALKQGVSVTWVEHQEMRSWMTKNPWRWLYKKHAKKVKIVPICRKNEKILTSQLHISPQRIVEIINGVKVKEIQKVPGNHKKGFVLAANRLIPKKGIRDFVAALMELDAPDTSITRSDIVGEGEEKAVILESLNDFRSIPVQLHGVLKKEKWYEMLHKADVFVSCARDQNETFSLNSAEALAAGCKLVVTSCSGIADYLEAGKEAIVVPPQDPQALAKAIEQALESPEELRQNGIKAAEKKFDQERMHQEYFQLITRYS